MDAAWRRPQARPPSNACDQRRTSVTGAVDGVGPRPIFCPTPPRRASMSSRFIALAAVSVALLALASAPAHAQQANDSAYTARIRELTPTDSNWKFTTELV